MRVCVRLIKDSSAQDISMTMCAVCQHVASTRQSLELPVMAMRQQRARPRKRRAPHLRKYVARIGFGYLIPKSARGTRETRDTKRYRSAKTIDRGSAHAHDTYYPVAVSRVPVLSLCRHTSRVTCQSLWKQRAAEHARCPCRLSVGTSRASSVSDRGRPHTNHRRRMAPVAKHI